MADISDQDKKAIGEQWARNLQPHAAAFAAAAAPAAAGGVNPQEFFCKEWPNIKAALQFLATIVPQPGPIIIGVVIAAGDAAYSRVCQK